jgi:hypothetical protein
MKIKTTIIAVFSAVVLAVGVTTAVLINSKPAQPDPQAVAEAQKVEAAQSERLEFTAEADKTVLEQTETKARVETKGSDFGPYVDSINGLKGGTDNKYWSFYVNGELAQKGAADYVTEGGETVEWRFE